MTEHRIVIGKLKAETKILLETKESVFEIIVTNPDEQEVIIFGGKRFTKPTVATIVGSFGSTDENKNERLVSPGELRKGFGVEIKYISKETEHDFITSGIISARLSGKGTGTKDEEGNIIENWEYELWGSANKNDILHDSLEEARKRFKK